MDTPVTPLRVWTTKTDIMQPMLSSEVLDTLNVEWLCIGNQRHFRLPAYFTPTQLPRRPLPIRRKYRGSVISLPWQPARFHKFHRLLRDQPNCVITISHRPDLLRYLYNCALIVHQGRGRGLFSGTSVVQIFLCRIFLTSSDRNGSPTTKILPCFEQCLVKGRSQVK